MRCRFTKKLAVGGFKQVVQAYHDDPQPAEGDSRRKYLL
jgi:hypothetical protein